MDTVSHIVLGAAVGETILGRKIGRKAMLYGAIIGNIPDIDVLGIFFLSDSKQLLFHRGITHSLFFAVLITALFGWFCRKRIKNNWMLWTWMFFAAMLSHLLIDSFTCYGMGFFEPFSQHRISFNTIFVVDPFYTLPLLVCMLLAFRAKNKTPLRKKWTITGLWISSTYLAFTILSHVYVQHVMKQSLEEQKLAFDHFTVTPTPLNSFLWMGYSHDKNGAWMGYYSIFDHFKKITYHRQQRNDSLLIPFQNKELVKNLKVLSKGNYCISKEDSIVYFNDIRFGQVSGWNTIADEAYAFKFNLNKNADNKRALNRLKYKESTSDWFVSLVNRIKGK
ncbi:metal-dependent hydrolase [Flavobacterium sp. IMCC34518]|uniref:metal-dependent hydrolase n=1 Tax=Flavobacterium sp. IMCC34518 TaxID=3003623 RepID=UPI0022ABFBD2|nr:metal-dependent hydrolase [Flavobacterium sp. IMCC34518]